MIFEQHPASKISSKHLQLPWRYGYATLFIILNVLNTKRGDAKNGSKNNGAQKQETSAYSYDVTTWGQVKTVSMENNT
jgi:hypothetical protein